MSMASDQQHPAITVALGEDFVATVELMAECRALRFEER